MSTFSEAWHNTPPKIRDFYRNFDFRYTTRRYPDFNLGANWTIRSEAPWNAYRNWAYQIADRGRFDVADVTFVDDFWFGYLPDTLPSDLFGFDNYTDQFRLVPDWAFDYPRDKYKVRRSYWTGAPRHRRNI